MNLEPPDINRYLPVFIYAKGQADRSVFIGNKLEGFEKQLNRFWTSVAETSWMTGPQAMQSAVSHIRKMGVANARIGVEMPFLPLDAVDVLRSAFPASRLVDVTMAMERLRSRKSAAELSLLREASERIVAAMQATFAACRAGMTKHEIVAQLLRSGNLRTARIRPRRWTNQLWSEPHVYGRQLKVRRDNLSVKLEWHHNIHQGRDLHFPNPMNRCAHI